MLSKIKTILDRVNSCSIILRGSVAVIDEKANKSMAPGKAQNYKSYL